MPASSKVACGSAPAAEEARTSEEVQERPARRFGSMVPLSARPRARRWPTRDRRSVTTAGVTMVPRSADQRVVVSAVHDLTPSTKGLHLASVRPVRASTHGSALSASISGQGSGPPVTRRRCPATACSA